MTIPGVGRSIANDLLRIGVTTVSALKNYDADELYALSNKLAGAVQDRCLLYTFRCAVYYAKTPERKRDPKKLKWWNWKDPAKTVKQSRLSS